ncbi:hypothetical protein [Leifsonia sp. Root227]|uniref:hypothetical protein n=1 Tax=Leifsonia sp. Root227 TaxID=1736496 RepID=UPI0012F7E378|nr:hypothetical protein [Leifsonia sp. Root227]
MLTSSPLILWASCATTPPSGRSCDDTVQMTTLTPWWLPLVIVAAFLVFLAAVVLIRTRRRMG